MQNYRIFTILSHGSMSESVFFHDFHSDTDSMKGGGDIHVSVTAHVEMTFEVAEP
jgi:hypothetical protein